MDNVKQKATEIALSLVGSDQNPQPLIEALEEMARWQLKELLKYGKVYEVERRCMAGGYIPSVFVPLKDAKEGEKVKVIVIK